jgi:hypothetical protein
LRTKKLGIAKRIIRESLIDRFVDFPYDESNLRKSFIMAIICHLGRFVNRPSEKSDDPGMLVITERENGPSIPATT